jgi:Ankyrin repeats (3 copies)/Ankyrin repeat
MPMCFGGGNKTDGRLSVFETVPAQWTEEKPATPLKQVTSMSNFGQRVLVVGQDYDGSPAEVRTVQVLLSDEGEHSWKDVSQSLLANSPRGWQNRDIIVSSADEKGFWLGARRGLLFVSSDGQTIKKWDTPSAPDWPLFDPQHGLPDRRVAPWPTRLRGAVTALAQDGDFLWMATTAEWDNYYPRHGEPFDLFQSHQNYIFLMHKPSRRWVGQFSVPSRVSALAVSTDRLWVGLAKPEDGKSLFQIDKRPLLQTPQDRWVSDDVPDEELYRQIAKLDVIEQAHYYFLLGDTNKVLAVLKKPTDADYADNVRQLISICSGISDAATNLASSPDLAYDLREAIREGDMEKVQTLFPLVKNENDLNDALCVAASWGKIEAVKFLLAQGLNVNVHVKDWWNGGTPLTVAAAEGRTDTVRELITHGAQLEAVDNDGNTALHNAARYGNAKTVAFLLEKGALVNAQKKDGWTPLMLAARCGSIATSKILLTNRAALSIENENGDTALAIATNDHRMQLVALLKK